MPSIVVTRRVFFEPARAVEAFREHLGVGRGEAQSLADAIAAGREIRLPVDSAETAHALSVALRDAGADAEPTAE
jgi:hypothetical protein